MAPAAAVPPVVGTRAPGVAPPGTAPAATAGPPLTAPAEAAGAAPVPWVIPGFSAWTPAPGAAAGELNPDEELGPPPGPDYLNPRFYARAEYLLWWVKGANTPVLVTTSSPTDFGILGAPTTQNLLGGTPFNGGARSGARFTVGGWLDCMHNCAFEVGGFFLGQANTNFTADSGAFPVLARPFFNLNSNQQFSQLTALPGVTTGNIVVHSPSNFYGLQANVLHKLCCGDCWQLNWLGGFRYLNLDERLTVQENIQGEATAPPPFTNQTITVFDSFHTRNQFYGGQAGIDGRYYFGRFSIDARATVALGATTQTIDIGGSQRFISPSGTVTGFTGGLLALPSNLGRHNQTHLSVVPEVGVNLGYQFTPHLRGYIGYNFLYWTNVVRPGDQIDTVLNVQQIPNFPTNSPSSNVNRPIVPFRQSDFWAQGLVFGIEFIF
jgi:hypothetical protein